MDKKQRLLKEFEWQNEFDEYTFDMEKHELIKWWRKDYIALERVRELACHWETMEPPVVHFNPEEQDEFVKNWIIQKDIFRFVAQELKLLLDGEQ